MFYYVLLAGWAALACGLALLAWRRPGRRQRIGRAAATLVAAAALWFIAFPPLRHLPAARGEAILLTEGYSPDTLRQLRQRLGAGTPVWQYGTAARAPKAQPLVSLLTLAEQRPALRRLHLLGHGLPVAEVPMLRGVPIKTHGGARPSPFRAASWNRQLVLGEVLQVEGTVALLAGQPMAWVGLRALGALRDSVPVPAGGGVFRLRYQPKVAGLAVAELVLRQGGKSLASEPVPFEVTGPQLPAVLLLAATPSFEFKFLKSHLAETRYPVALRTAVSRGLVQTDFSNQPARALDRISSALLAAYRLVVADAQTLAGLSASESQALQAAVSAGRLGLVLLADDVVLPRSLPGRADFALVARPAAQASPQPLQWPNAPAGTKAALPAHLRPALALRPLVTSAGQVVAVARRRTGAGFVVVSAVPSTFQWALQGQQGTYASYWNRVLNGALPPAPSTAGWQLGSRWPRPQQPLVLHLTAALPTAAPTVRGLAGGPAVRLALRQDSRLPEWSSAQYWPASAGWHQVRGPGAATHSFYVYPASAWQGPEGEERRLVLENRETQVAPAHLQSAEFKSEPWPLGWFFGLFLLAAAYLWFEEKL